MPLFNIDALGASAVPAPPVATPAWKISSVSCRPLSGSSSTCSFVITCPMPGLRVSTSAALPWTVTVSSSWPSSSATASVGFAPTCSTIPVCTYVRNPPSVASNRYGPTGRFCSTYDPVSSVTAVRVNPVSVWVTVTVTPGRARPAWSRTVR